MAWPRPLGETSFKNEINKSRFRQSDNVFCFWWGHTGVRSAPRSWTTSRSMERPTQTQEWKMHASESWLLSNICKTSVLYFCRRLIYFKSQNLHEHCLSLNKHVLSVVVLSFAAHTHVLFLYFSCPRHTRTHAQEAQHPAWYSVRWPC